jgi:phospholipase C
MAGEGFIKDVYEALRKKKSVWESSALLVLYDEHGGLYDHMEPPACPPDEFQDADTGFQFDRLGVRVPAVLVSPWVPEGTVVPSSRVFDHASIPATVTEHFIGSFDARSPREKNAGTFLDLLSLAAPRTDTVSFPAPSEPLAATPMNAAVPASPVVEEPEGNPARLLTMDSLLWDHVLHMFHLEARLPVKLQTNTYLGSIKTEGDAAAYIGKVTALLADQGRKKVAAKKGKKAGKKKTKKAGKKKAAKKSPKAAKKERKKTKAVQAKKKARKALGKKSSNKKIVKKAPKKSAKKARKKAALKARPAKVRKRSKKTRKKG